MFNPRTLNSDKEEEQTFFATSHLQYDLRNRSIRGGIITLGTQLVKFVISTISIMWMARLLTPYDFGLVAMVAPITGFISLFKDLGLSTATIQRTELNHEQVNSLFWMNFLTSILLMIVTLFAAPLVGWFYNDQRAIWITVASSFLFPISGLTSQHIAITTRQMRFTSLAFIGFISILVSSIAGIFAAIYGFGYWSLVIFAAASEISRLIMAWIVVKWRPSLPIRTREIKGLMSFGFNLTGFNLVNYLSRNLDNVLIGWYHGAFELGFYSRAYGLLLMPLEQIRDPVSSIVVPSLSRLQNDPIKYRNYYYKALSLLSSTTLPLITFMAIMSENIVRVFLGDQWLRASTIFSILAVASLSQAVFTTVGWLYLSSGRTDRMFKWSLIAIPLTIISFLVGLPWGATGVAIAYALVNMILMIPTIWFSLKSTSLSLRGVFQATWKSYLISGILALILISLKKTIPEVDNHLRGLIVSAAISLFIWVLWNFSLYRKSIFTPEFQKFIIFVKDGFGGRRKLSS